MLVATMIVFLAEETLIWTIFRLLNVIQVESRLFQQQHETSSESNPV